MTNPSGPTVADIGEFPVIERAVRARRQPDSTLVGPGHDAAVVTASDGRIAISTDMLVEGRHFRFDWSSPEEVGRKAVAQNGADVAAVGARPTAFVVGLGCPPETPVAVLDGISAGIGEAAEEIGAGVVGGDLVQAGQVIVSVTVLGELDGRPPLLRSTACPGDVVALAGRIGRSAAGLALLLAGNRNFPELVAAHRVPTPPYAAGPAAAAAGAHACTDISDGLVADLEHICTASEVAIDLDSGALAPDTQLRETGRVLAADPWEWILTGGEDHALAACFPREVALPDGWRPIGVVLEGFGVTVDGQRRDGSGGWESFAAGAGH
ncbi:MULTISPECIES: thiamine-phosphate kinase [Rhodococcus]|uniref:thiamine-phosphate kinase n=1 Tax=Rhodococcus TaxID=1827 RepID=UPI00069058CB|nr:thiamine-phosphate kinase [Rhodococcus pyridinivorans]AOD24412.1 thiamine-phosphate kinase [Rhodococcus sp. p52]MDJ0481823.1 thiamine-phosphate kinase [Rhodococcus pyridinivorans]UGQ56813.1 thiamine-phosphate kinase [Rhodococcus pyridinivorans]